MGITCRWQDNFAMLQTQDHNDRYIIVPDIKSCDYFGPKEEMKHNVVYNINVVEYQNSSQNHSTNPYSNIKASLCKNCIECILL